MVTDDWPMPVRELASQLADFDWISDFYVSGSLATGDYRPGVSDIDLVAIAGAIVSGSELVRRLTKLHSDIDRSSPPHTNLGCAYLDRGRVADVSATHQTWTHGRLIRRPFSPIARAELTRYGKVVFGKPVESHFPAMTEDDIRRAARAELVGYWSTAVRRPWWWLDPTIADLGLTSMARSRHAIATGQLMTKSAAIEHIGAPTWLRDDLRARRAGRSVRSPRLKTALIAWQDARRTTAS